ncbi:MAG TPA: carbohydrate kinase family protein [Tenericutes bacterium]|nr:carbohydrate kinase family protein [Mycoplasmatota bacterium]
MKILCIGLAVYDISFPVTDFPKENSKNRVSDKIECGGGPASNAAYLLAKWGLDVTFMGAVGNDTFGHKIKEEFDNVGVDTRYLEINDNYETPISFIIPNVTNGSRTTMTYRNSSIHTKSVELDFTPDVIFIDGQEYDLSVELLKKYKNAISIIDAGSVTKERVELCKLVDYVVTSKNFAEDYSGIKIDYSDFSTIENLYSKLEDDFKTNIVVTLESKGALYKDLDGLKIMPSIKVKPIDSTGAGDIFHGAFTYGIVKKMDMKKIIKFSNIAGALATTKIGGRNSIYELDYVLELYEKNK